MEIRGNGTRFSEYDQWEDVKHQPYNYTKNGLLTHIMSNSIVNTSNSALRFVLQYVESSLIYIMKYTDILKNFKNIHWKNR